MSEENVVFELSLAQGAFGNVKDFVTANVEIANVWMQPHDLDKRNNKNYLTMYKQNKGAEIKILT